MLLLCRHHRDKGYCSTGTTEKNKMHMLDHITEDRIAVAGQTPQSRQNCYCLTDTTEKKHILLLDRDHRDDSIAIA